MERILPILLLTILAVSGFSQTVRDGNVSCSDLGYSNSFKIDSPQLGYTTYQLPLETISTTFDTLDKFSFLASAAIVQAVIVKGGTQSNVYTYPNPTNSGTDLVAPINVNGTHPDISHVEFCYTFRNTAAQVSIQGKVVNSAGRGVGNVMVSVYDASTGQFKSSLTNPFGYYIIEGLDVNNFYVVQARSKYYSFEPRGLTLRDNVTDYDLIAR